MKRLLTCLFLVMGLGLVVNINAEAKTKIDLSFCKVSDYNIFAALTDRFYNDCTRNSGNKISYQKFLQSRMKHICFNTRTKNVMSRQLPCVKDLGHSKVFYENGSFYYNTIETQIAKKEPTQTDDGNNITQQLKDLNEMYKSGALTKEEFTKAKKKLLN